MFLACARATPTKKMQLRNLGLVMSTSKCLTGPCNSPVVTSFYRLAIRDYLQAINDMSDCVTYCFRAVESIKSSFSFRSGNDSWDEMLDALGTDRATITSVIKDFSGPVRHGNWVNAKRTDKFIRWRMLELTKQILRKYLDVEQPVI